MPNTLDGVLLLGWMEKDEAINWLTQHCWSEQAITPTQAEALWEKYRAVVKALPDPRPIPKVESKPIPPSAQAHVKQFLARHKGPEVLDVMNVDPRQLVIYQFYVAVSRSDEHAKNGSKAWAETCLQIRPPAVESSNSFGREHYQNYLTARRAWFGAPARRGIPHTTRRRICRRL